MPKTDTPEEQARQRKLDSYRLLDTLPEAAYDDIVRVASVLCDVPTALITLVDHDRQWFKAKVGIEARQTSRDVAFCDHAIRTPEQPMIIPDATQDPRFAENPLVTGQPGIRFYAGVPLQAPTGEALGTVCVIDREPREIETHQVEGLQALARLAIELMEDHRERLERARIDADRAFRDAGAQEATASGGAAAAAVAIIELDHVAQLRETEGPDAVARLLAAISSRVNKELSGRDILGPHGDHELLLVLADGHGAEDLLARIRHAVVSCDAVKPATITIGAAVAATRAQPMEALFLKADDALARARASGGNQVKVQAD
jgi:diguanylate cyclase (GGDEF)-like protein